MSVTVRPYRRAGWQVDVQIRLPNGDRYRERRVLTHSKSAAHRWGQDRERHLLQHGPGAPKKEVPTLAEFAPRFLDGHTRANRQKPSGIATTTGGDPCRLRKATVIGIAWNANSTGVYIANTRAA